MQKLLLLLLLLVSAALAALAAVGYQTQKARRELATIIARGIEVGSIEASWKCGGRPVTFKSTRLSTETETQWAARARAEYDALLAAFPPDA